MTVASSQIKATSTIDYYGDGKLLSSVKLELGAFVAPNSSIISINNNQAIYFVSGSPIYYMDSNGQIDRIVVTAKTPGK